METTYPEIGKDIVAKKMITEETRAALTKALEAFKVSWQG